MKKWMIGFLLCLASGQGLLAAGEAPSVEENIKRQVEGTFPEIVVEKISKSEVSGLYQLTAGPVILYASNDGRYLVTGDVLDLQLKAIEDRNITEKARRKIRSGVLEQLKLADMVVYSPKEVKGVVTVFTDPDCFYCRKLHEEIPKLTELGIQLRYLAFPRQGPGSSTYNKMVSVWCAADRGSAMTSAMQNQDITSNTCENAIEDQFMLGQKFGVNGTPAVVFSDGTLSVGYHAAEKLAEKAIKIQSKE